MDSTNLILEEICNLLSICKDFIKIVNSPAVEKTLKKMVELNGHLERRERIFRDDVSKAYNSISKANSRIREMTKLLKSLSQDHLIALDCKADPKNVMQILQEELRRMLETDAKTMHQCAQTASSSLLTIKSDLKELEEFIAKSSLEKRHIPVSKGSTYLCYVGLGVCLTPLLTNLLFQPEYFHFSKPAVFVGIAASVALSFYALTTKRAHMHNQENTNRDDSFNKIVKELQELTTTFNSEVWKASNLYEEMMKQIEKIEDKLEMKGWVEMDEKTLLVGIKKSCKDLLESTLHS